MTQGLGHGEDVFYQTVCTDLDFGFCYLADSEKPEPVEAAGIAVGMQVADTKQQQCTDMGSMAQEPYVLEFEGIHSLSRHLPRPLSSQ